MTSTLRAVLAVLVLLVLGGLIGVASWQARRPDDSAAAIAWDSPEDCRPCHAEAYGEWEASRHRRAWSDPNVQASFQQFGFDRKCESCHAPQPVLVTGLDAPAELRDGDRDGGVTCLSCHLLPDGRGVAASRTVADAPCRPIQTPELGQGGLCGVCHTAIYQDWQERPAGPESRSCRDCHMPAVSTRLGGYSHLCLGGHHAETVLSAAQVRCRREGGELVVSVANRAAGHNFPGERHHRLLILEVLQRSAAGEITLVRQETIKGITPFRGESSAEKIRAGQSIELRFPVLQAGTARVRLLYKLFPWHSDNEALVVHEEEVKLEK